LDLDARPAAAGLAAIGMVRAACGTSAAQPALAIPYRCWRHIMNTLLVKDLPKVEEIDCQTAQSVRGGMLTISRPPEPDVTLPKMPGMPPVQVSVPPIPPITPVHTGGYGGPTIMPYHVGSEPTDPRLQ
jgi:hypothetical protein